MDPLRTSVQEPGREAIAGLARGLCIGVIGVVAIAAWAVNFDDVLSGQAGSTFGAVARIILCDAVPLATLFAIYRGIGRNHNLERMVLGILHTICQFLGGFLYRRAPQEDENAAVR